MASNAQSAAKNTSRRVFSRIFVDREDLGVFITGKRVDITLDQLKEAMKGRRGKLSNVSVYKSRVALAPVHKGFRCFGSATPKY
ncbi:hypothetical protein HHI36_002498 [Cryptolaemus montrouzieri]|uniref:Uncharacterized protein n=1 Tax=Cryptolaemus montrouzieri TaxID=559131 RepID=A0ABD2PAQ3_9CUCU